MKHKVSHCIKTFKVESKSRSLKAWGNKSAPDSGGAAANMIYIFYQMAALWRGCGHFSIPWVHLTVL